MVPDSRLVRLVQLVDRLSWPPAPSTRPRGRPRVYPDRRFLKALVSMVVKHLAKPHSLLAILAEDTAELRQLRELLSVNGRFPARRTWDRRRAAIPTTLPAQIGCLGRHLVELLTPWADGGRAAAIASTVLRACGGVWHRKDREAGVVPHSSIDTEAGWTKSGWHGWVDGWKLHLVTTVAEVWLPLAAELTPANTADNQQAPARFDDLPSEVRFVLGDTAYQDGALAARCAAADRVLTTPQRGGSPPTDVGVGVRRIFHELRSRTIEHFNGQFKAVFDVPRAVSPRGRQPTRRYGLGAVLVYQLVRWDRVEQGATLRTGLKAYLQAA